MPTEYRRNHETDPTAWVSGKMVSAGRSGDREGLEGQHCTGLGLVVARMDGMTAQAQDHAPHWEKVVCSRLESALCDRGFRRKV